MQTDMPPSPTWSMAKKTGLLFLTVYLFFLFADFTSSDEIFPPFMYSVMKPYIAFWDWLVPWTGSHILHIGYPITIKPNGSGDTTYNYVMQLLWVVLALLIAAVWAFADRRRPSYNQLYYWVRIFTRYYFAYVLFVYGFFKIIKLQFPFPNLYRLTEPYGDSSPMGLAWTFVGYSKGYNLFTGGAEVLGGILLFFRRTSLLGSLVAMTVMINVAAMNLAYDIPVKIFSLNLVCVAIFLAAHDFDRIKSLFFLQGAVPAGLDDRPVITRRRLLVQRTLKALFLFFALYFTLWSAIVQSATRGDTAPRPPLYGIYHVESFVKQGVALPPLTTDTFRWKQLIIQSRRYAHITTMADSAKWMTLKLDTVQKSISLGPDEDAMARDSFFLRYHEPDKDHLLLSGLMYGDSVRISMKRFDINKFRLVNRGFHWINETPYNR